MKPLARLLWKELRELLRPQYLLPLLVLPLIFVGLGQGMAGVNEALSDRPSVGLVVADDDRLGEHAAATIRRRSEVVYRTEEPPESIRAAAETVRERDGTALLVVGENFTERIRAGRRASVGVYTPVREVSLLSVATSAEVDGLVEAAERNVTLTATNATATTLDPTRTAHVTYVKGQRVGASPGAISGAFTQKFMFVPVVIVFVILFSGQMVVQSMGIEKENRTLETLLTMPVARWKLAAAKLAAGATIGLLATMLYTGGIYAYQQSMRGFGSGSSPFSLTPVDYALVGASVFLALVGVLALALVLGLFVDDRQGGQVLLLPISALTIVPMFATMFTDVSALPLAARALLYAVPLTHPIIAPKRLLFDEVGVVLAGVGYEVVFAVAMVALAARLFQSDRLVTGNAGRLSLVLRFLQR